MQVTTWTLESTTPPSHEPRPLPADVRVDLADGLTPEYARFLYGVVGGPWRWTDRLAWPRERWAADLAVPGTETWVAYRGGQPAGFVQLQAAPGDGGSHVEIRYFGLVLDAIGTGLGAALLELGIDRAWSLPERHGLPPASRVWVHTCDLDGPAALANYERRGLRLVRTEVTDEDYPAQALGAWRSTGGPS